MKINSKADSFVIPDPSSDSVSLQKFRNQSPSRRKLKNAGRSVAGVSVKRDGSALVGRRSRPETPFLRWKYNEGENDVPLTRERLFPPECNRRKVKGNKEKVTEVSARKLAGVLWKMYLPETSAAIVGANTHLGFQSPRPPFESQDQIQNHWSIFSTPKNGHFFKEPSNSALEGATKWNHPISISEEIQQIYAYTEPNIELEQAQARIHELESEKRTSKKKLEHFLKKLSEERSIWRNKEHEKIRLAIDDMKANLNKEKKTRQRMEIMNSKLVNEIYDTKLLAKRYMSDHDKERKARILIEEVCEELAKEIREDKEEVETLKKEYLKHRDEVEDERKILQMAEVWREERVQMKLVDIKVAIEDKYSYMNNLISSLDSFLHPNKTLNMEETRKAISLCQAAQAVNIKDIMEYTYEPSKSDDIFAAFENMSMGDVEDDEGYSSNRLSEEDGLMGKKENVKIISVDGNNQDGKVSNESAASSMDGELGQWSSPEVGNMDIRSLKSKLVETQKIQLRQALKQRI